MIKSMIKDQIRKTGIVKELEMVNSKLENQLIFSEKENEALKSQLTNLKIENERLSTTNSELVGYSLKTNLRGVSPDEGKPAIMKYILENIRKDAKMQRFWMLDLVLEYMASY